MFWELCFGTGLETRRLLHGQGDIESADSLLAGRRGPGRLATDSSHKRAHASPQGVPASRRLGEVGV